METVIWVVVIFVSLATIIVTAITNVTKLSNKVVEKYVKEEDITKNHIEKSTQNPSDKM